MNRHKAVIDSTPDQSSMALGAKTCRQIPELSINSARLR